MSQKIEQSEAQACLAIAKQAEHMEKPCIQIDTVFPLTIQEWAKFYYLVSTTTKKIADQMKLPFFCSITEATEVPKKFVECPEGNNGDHELMEFSNEKINSCIICINCGKLFRKTGKSPDELKKHFAGLQKTTKGKPNKENEQKS